MTDCYPVSAAGTSKHLPPLVLASASPRRRELLAQIGVSFEVKPVDTDETPLPNEEPLLYVRRLAEEKARAGLWQAAPGAVVLGSDTAVIGEGRLLGKPKDRAEAVDMLMHLSGTTHLVATGIALVSGTRLESLVVTTEVTFRALSETECQAYWDTGEPADKAGAYGIQGLGAVFVERITGSYSAVVGLPLKETAELLSRFGIPIWQQGAD